MMCSQADVLASAKRSRSGIPFFAAASKLGPSDGIDFDSNQRYPSKASANGHADSGILISETPAVLTADAQPPAGSELMRNRDNSPSDTISTMASRLSSLFACCCPYCPGRSTAAHEESLMARHTGA